MSVQEAAAADAEADHQNQSFITNETMPIIEILLGSRLDYLFLEENQEMNYNLLKNRF